MKTPKLLLLSLGIAALFASCGAKDDENPTGSWKSASPISVTENIIGASTATKTMTMDFSEPVGEAPGEVVLTATYDVKLTPESDKPEAITSYQATATIKGTWMQSVDDKDDYILSFDRNTLDVKGIDAPELGPVTDAFINYIASLTTIEDVKVSKDKTNLSFETENPDVKYVLVSNK